MQMHMHRTIVATFFGWWLLGAFAVPAWAQVGSITAGRDHFCALTTAGAVQCWGFNVTGALGDGTTATRRTPVPVSSLGSGVQAITAGNSHTCALTTAGAVLCWGSNQFGFLGNGTTTNSLTPVAVTGLSSGVQAIGAGQSHTCAVTTAGAVLCWGHGVNGQLGNGSTANRLMPFPVTSLDSGVQAVAGGNFHACALTTTGAVQCWGTNTSGQLGDGTTLPRPTPALVTSLSSGVQAIAVGGLHSCALTTAGATQCWGSNVFGQLGDDTTMRRTTPVTVIGLGSGVQAVAAGETHTCAVTMTGAVQCWGSNSLGELGDGTTMQGLTPVAVNGLGNGMRAVAAGRHNTCALSTGGVVLCWGRNDAGQLGDGTQTQRSTPVVVLGDWLQVFRDGFE